MENIFVYLYICIYNFMYTFSGAQLWERKINTTARVKKKIQIGLHVKLLNKAIKTNLTARLYKILLLWSPSDEQQQTDYNWPLHIMRMSWFLFYKVIHVMCPPLHTNTHRNVPTEETASEVRLKQKSAEFKSYLSVLRCQPQGDYSKHDNDCDWLHWHIHAWYF